MRGGETARIKRRLDREPAGGAAQAAVDELQPFLRIGERAVEQLLRVRARLTEFRQGGDYVTDQPTKVARVQPTPRDHAYRHPKLPDAGLKHRCPVSSARGLAPSKGQPRVATLA